MTLAVSAAFAGLLTSAATVSSAAAQSHGTISGVVTSRADKNPVRSARVYLHSTTYSVATDDTGRFVIAGVRPATYTLMVQHTGFVEMRDVRVTVAGGETTTLQLELDRRVLPIQEVVRTGVIEPTSALVLPFTVARLGAAQLSVPANGSWTSALIGKVAGVSVIRQSGLYESRRSITLRTGAGRQSPAAPLLIVDGIVLSRFAGVPELDLDPAEIESIEILKGAAAASAYGVTSAAGVISITTKRGEFAPASKLHFDYRVDAGFDLLGPQIPLSRHHHYLMNADGTSFVNAAGQPVDAANAVASRFSIADAPFPGQQYDQVDALFQSGRAVRQKLIVSRNGPSTALLLALNRADQSGQTVASGDTRNQARITFDHHVGDRLGISLDATYLSSGSDGRLVRNAYATALTYAPNTNVGAQGTNERYVRQPDPWTGIENPLWSESQGSADTRDLLRTVAGTTIHYDPFLWLSLSAQLGYDAADDDGKEVYSPLAQRGYAHHWEKRDVNLAATSTHQVGGLSLRAQVRAWQTRETAELSDSSFDGGAFNSRSVWSKQKRRSYGVALSGDFRNRYIIDALVTRDSVPYIGEEWQTNYRAAAGYRITAEPWFKVRGLDELVLRYGYGTAGGDLFVTAFDAERPTVNRSSVSEHEIGLNAVLLNRRLSAVLAYSGRTAREPLFVQAPPSLGTGITPTFTTEAGHTLEATIQARILDSQDVAIDLSVVMDRSRNRIDEWNRSCFTGDLELVCSGAESGHFWVIDFLRSPNDLPSWFAGREAEFQVNDDGYLVWVGAGNTYRDGLAKQLWGTSIQSQGITYRWGEPIALFDPENFASARVDVGSGLPEMNYGFVTNVDWRHLSVRGEFRGQLGGKVYNRAKQNLYFWGRHEDVDQSTKPDEEKKPIDYYRRLRSSGGWAAPFVEDATYFRIGALSAQYRLDRTQLVRVFGSIAPREITMALTGRNLLTLTGYSGTDPEAGTLYSRVDFLDQPQLRTITATVQLRF